MSSSVPPPEDDVLAAVVDTLQGDGLTVGFTDATGLDAPYAVVDLIDWPPSGPAGDWNADVDALVQVRCVAAHPRGVTQLKDRIRGVLLAAGDPVTVAGHAVRVGLSDGSFGPEVDRTVEPPLHVGAVTFELFVTPSPS